MDENCAPHDTCVPTGVPGLDYVLGGGFLRRGFYLLQGDPGSGKTTFALQYLMECGRRGEPGLYVTLTETKADLELACRSHGWALDSVEICDLTRADFNLAGKSDYVVFHPSEVELGETTRQILAEVERTKPQHLVFDGLSELRLLAADPLRYRRQLLSLKHHFEQQGTTVLLLDDRSNPMGHIQPESLVGGNIVLEKYLPGYGGARRRLSVTKVRGADFRDGYHDYEIRKGGVVVHPRLVAAEHHDRFEPKMFASGVANLDKMLEGGLQAGTTTLLLGPAGVGKSTIGMQYVAKALKEGRRAAVFTFDEVIETLFARSEKLCLDGIRGHIASGQLHAQQVDPAELSPGEFADKVSRVVEEGAKVIVIDSLNGYLSAMPEERFLTTHLHELFSYLNQKGVVTIVVVAQHGLLMANAAELDVSYLADTVLLLRYFEVDAQIRQAVSVFKKRTGPHERSLRELLITKSGVQVGEPLRDFRGILTGVPQYEGKVRPLVEGEAGDA
ncbi:ATPase domain-containing protein [Tautonia plasticadhaerens]|uniref:non-specific serine/threonine protein kinase n=1 Tax=Tautonia plasticadhaerens TaxID=2527974 RepID=A0A518GYV2_9BACT|nr:ATPase domain-containing protein [Tautonia plasticadhaerens]QDV33722.1 Circadian clock protein kinase KaiC [Tautonia plasticadhaerens]